MPIELESVTIPKIFFLKKVGVRLEKKMTLLDVFGAQKVEYMIRETCRSMWANNNVVFENKTLSILTVLIRSDFYNHVLVNCVEKSNR